jgi:ribonuclease Y
MPTSALWWIVSLIVLLAAIIIAFVLGVLYRKRVSEREISSAEEEAKRIINEAIKSSESKKREALLEANEEIHKDRVEYERDVKERRNEIRNRNGVYSKKKSILTKKPMRWKRKMIFLLKKSQRQNHIRTKSN